MQGGAPRSDLPLLCCSGKTRLIITNQLQYLRQCDGVIVLDRGEDGSGYIRLQGPFEELVRDPGFAQTLAEYGEGSGGAQQEQQEAGAGSEDPVGAAGEACKEKVGIAAPPPPGSAGTADPAAVAAKGGEDAGKAAAGAVVAKPSGAAPGGLIVGEEKSEGAVQARGEGTHSLAGHLMSPAPSTPPPAVQVLHALPPVRGLRVADHVAALRRLHALADRQQ